MARGYEFDRKVRLGFDSDGDALPGLNLSSSTLTLSIAGVDEVGRGPLAGPVVAAAVILADQPCIEGLNDSKKVPAQKREELSLIIRERAVAFAVSVIENDIIDTINILAASLLAMRNAIRALSVRPQLVLVDGNQKVGCGLPEKTLIKGDGLSASIMAASIIAKVARDRIMTEAHEKFPHYGFRDHKGYGSKQHLDALREYGPCPLHRVSFGPVRAALGVRPLQLI